MWRGLEKPEEGLVPLDPAPPTPSSASQPDARFAPYIMDGVLYRPKNVSNDEAETEHSKVSQKTKRAHECISLDDDGAPRDADARANRRRGAALRSGLVQGENTPWDPMYSGTGG